MVNVLRVECIWNGNFTYVRRIRPDSGTSYQYQVFEPTIFFNIISQHCHVCDSKTKHESKNTILLWEHSEQRTASCKEKRELHIRPNCSVVLFYPNVALIITDLIGTIEKYFNAYDARYMPRTRRRKKNTNQMKKRWKRRKKENKFEKYLTLVNA